MKPLSRTEWRKKNPKSHKGYADYLAKFKKEKKTGKMEKKKGGEKMGIIEDFVKPAKKAPEAVPSEIEQTLAAFEAKKAEFETRGVEVMNRIVSPADDLPSTQDYLDLLDLAADLHEGYNAAVEYAGRIYAGGRGSMVSQAEERERITAIRAKAQEVRARMGKKAEKVAKK